MVDKEKISSAEIFKELNKEQLEKIADLCEEVIFNDDDKILTERETTDFYFILVEGQVDLRFELPFRETSKEMTVLTVAPGECFSWSAIVSPHKATLSGYSVGKSKAIKIPGAKLMRLFEKDNSIGYPIMKKLASMIAGRLTKQQELFIQELGDSLQFKW
jgi:CRP-like cAMP-binding protein